MGLEQAEPIEGKTVVTAHRLGQQHRQVQASQAQSPGVGRDRHDRGPEGEDAAAVDTQQLATKRLGGHPVWPELRPTNRGPNLARIRPSGPDPDGLPTRQCGRPPAGMEGVGRRASTEHPADYTEAYGPEPQPVR
jgi:hypothetical protein